MADGMLLDALKAATSQDPGILKQAEDALKSWEEQPGFYQTLAAVLTNKQLETPVRWIAANYIKNAVDRRWRRGAVSPIAVEEKEAIRSCLLLSLEEPVLQVSTQLAILVAKIARMDCPADWPELLPTLTVSVQSPSLMVQFTSLLTLKHVVKTLAGRRLADDRKLFYKITEDIFVYMCKLWEHFTQLLLSQQDPSSLRSDCPDNAKNCMKVLRQLLVFGFPRFHVVPEAVTMVNLFLDKVKVFVDLRTKCDAARSKDIESMITITMKTLIELQNHHPLGYVSFLDDTYHLIISYAFTPTGTGKLYEKFTVQLLKFLRQILRCEDYQLAPATATLTSITPPPEVLQAQRSRTDIFKCSVLQEMAHQLIINYIAFGSEDLVKAVECPEEFVLDEGEGELYQVALKPCAEVTFLTLFSEFQLAVKPIVIEMLHAVQGWDASCGEQKLTEKEAVYHTVGLAAYELYDDINYDEWYTSHLVQEVEITDERYLLVRYRVIWLLGSWVSVKMSSELRPSLYSLLLRLLHPNEPLLIKLAASQSLHSAVDDFGFINDDFSPYLSSIMSHLLQLLGDVDECETKLKVLGVISLIIERAGRNIQPHVLAVAQQMPLLWEQSAEHNLLRCAILTTLMRITQGLGQVSTGLHPLLLPVIRLATDTSQASYVYLGEDGLNLWLTTLEHSTAISVGLLQLFSESMLNVMGLGEHTGVADLSPDSLLACFRIIGAYCTLGGADFLQSCGPVVVKAFEEYLGDVTTECTVVMLEVMNRIIRMYPMGGPEMIRKTLLSVLLRLLRSEGHPPVTAGYFNTLAHLLYYNCKLCFAIIEEASSHLNQNVEQFFCSIIDLWYAKLDMITSMEQRKMIGLAIASLLPLTDRCVMSKFGVLLNICLEVLHDICNYDDLDNRLYDNMCTPEGEARDTTEHEEYSEEEKRRKKMEQVDPIWMVELHRYVSSKLSESQQMHSAANFHLLICNTQQSVREQLCEYLPEHMALLVPPQN